MGDTTSKNYHKALGVSKKATKDEIKKAYRRLAMLYHPDRNRSEGAEEKFKEINEAYAVLTGKEKPPETRNRGQGTGNRRPATPQEAWAMEVLRIWDEMETGRSNMYR